MICFSLSLLHTAIVVCQSVYVYVTILGNDTTSSNCHKEAIHMVYSLKEETAVLSMA